MTTELVHISIGELWDKYTILLIKREKITNIEKQKSVSTEIEFLKKNMDKYDYSSNEFFICMPQCHIE